MGSTDLAAARLYTASSMGNIDVVKNLVSVNGGLIRSPDEHGLHPGFTGPNAHRHTNTHTFAYTHLHTNFSHIRTHARTHARTQPDCGCF